MDQACVESRIGRCKDGITWHKRNAAALGRHRAQFGLREPPCREEKHHRSNVKPRLPTDHHSPKPEGWIAVRVPYRAGDRVGIGFSHWAPWSQYALAHFGSQPDELRFKVQFGSVARNRAAGVVELQGSRSRLDIGVSNEILRYDVASL